jgi:hypothetical protein
LAYAAGRGARVSIGAYGVALEDQPCAIPGSVAAELARNSKLRIERIEAKPAAPAKPALAPRKSPSRSGDGEKEA